MQRLPQRTLVVGIDSDLLYPLPLSQQMADALPNATLLVVLCSCSVFVTVLFFLQLPSFLIVFFFSIFADYM
jgi:hypothetical protein